MNVVNKAKEIAPNALDSASGLNIAAFNIGIAGASLIGSVVVDYYGVQHNALVAAALLFIAFAMSAHEVFISKNKIKVVRA